MHPSIIGSRLRLRSPSELGFRARQRIQIWLELFSGAAGGQEPDDGLLARVLSGRSPTPGVPNDREPSPSCAFASFIDGGAIGSLVAARFPEAASRIIARASRAVADRFDIFGHEGLSYGDPVDWHLDPLRQRRAPQVHWSRVPFLDVQRVGDHKVIWELNRHQHLVTLGQAYCLTGDEQYAETIVRHLTQWMDANPPKVGINWSSSLELAFRIISWTWALRLIRSSAAVSTKVRNRVLKFLYIHARHVTAHLSTYFSPNTHLTGEALGLLYVGTCFEEFRDAERWRELAWSILQAELERQVRPDGTYFEQTTWYQRYTADFYLHTLQLRAHAGDRVPEHVLARVNRLFDVLVQFTDPTGLTPLIGDDDGGQLLPLAVTAPNDFRATLAHAAVVLGRSDCAALAGPGVACLPWLVGSAGLAAFDTMDARVPVDTARLFADGGYFVARSRWAPNADHVVVDCGPHGSSTCGHAHADALAVVLSMGGTPLLVDPGTYSYAPPERDEFRTTPAHNTITIDGLSSSEPDRPFRWKTAASCTILRTAADETFAYLEGEHDGFMRLPDPVRHRRTVFVIYGELSVFLDTVEAKSHHVVRGRLHFDPRLTISARPERTEFSVFVRGNPEQPVADIFVVGPDVTVATEDGHVAPTYAVLTEATVGTFTSVGVGTRSFWTVISRRREASEPAPRVVSAGNGGGLAVTRGDGQEILICPAGVSISDDIVSDARWTWIKRRIGQSRPTEFTLLDGAMLSVAGETLASLPACRTHVRGHLTESGWQLDVSPPQQTGHTGGHTRD